ncbi:DWNN domain [Abeliophyllum distichum]|uniref:DWNN domain n=1 Tax=Abeliophyllum distichum TaxID=126358 RepID=A0ABD1UJF2_9LAMI
MAVYYKFKSAKDYDTVAIDGHFISVGHLKEKIFESKHLGRGTDFDLVVTNAQTNEEYLDEEMLIPKNTSVLIRRVPGRPRMPIVTAPSTAQDEPKVEDISVGAQAIKSSFVGADSSAMEYTEEAEWDEFGNDLYAIPEPVPVQSSNPVQDAPPSKADEDSKIMALIDTPALDWQRQSSDGFGPGRGFGRGMGGRMMGGRGFGRGGFERKTPPVGYICHRCKVPGHFIQHCPTNGDSNYDVKRVKPPTGIPKSMLMATPEGSYALPSGAVAALKPNDAAFEKEIEGMPSTRSVGDLPPELHCPLCKEVMKDAVLTSKCCFKSFCDKCIRDYIISKSICICGATNILADDLLPNKTVRDTINRILESNNGSAENGGSNFQVQDMESRNPHRQGLSPTQSFASKGEQKVEKGGTPKVADVSEVIHESVSVKEPASQGSAPLVDEEVQQKPVSGDAGKKKKKKRMHLPPNVPEMQWRTSQDLAVENYMMPMGPCAYNPYWTGIQPGMEAFVPPYGGPMPYMGGFGHMDLAFGGVLPPDPFAGPVCRLPYGPPQRDLADLAMGFNSGPRMMGREDFEARKAELKRKHEMDRNGNRELSKDREYGREMSNTSDLSSMKSKSKSILPPPNGDHHPHYLHRPERPSIDGCSRDTELPRLLSKRKSDYDGHHHRDNSDGYHQQDQREDPRPSSKNKSDYDHHHRDNGYHHQDHQEDHHRRDYHDNHQHRDHHNRSSHRGLESSAAAKPPPSVPPVESASLTSMTDKKQKPSVFSRISFPEKDVAASKKRKLSSSTTAAPGSASASHRVSASNGYHEEHKAVAGSRKSAAAPVEYESSDDDRHFKRRPSRYTSSPPPAAARKWDGEESRHSRGSRERERDRDRYGKHG